MSSERQVRFRRDEQDGVDGPRWIVLVDGHPVGKVEQRRIRHDRKPRGSRIVTYRTYSNRWVGVVNHRRAGVSWYDTRIEATEKVLMAAFPEIGSSDAYQLAKAARNETKAERAAAQDA